MRLIPVRAVVIIVTVILFVATVACVAGAAFGNWRFGLPTHDKTTVINTVVAVGAFVLVAWGVVVALAAYVSATGTPDLSVELKFPLSETNKPVFRLSKKPEIEDFLEGNMRYLDDIGIRGTLVIANSSKYSARNPGVRIAFEGLNMVESQEGWLAIAESPRGGHSILQWDGGTDYIIHGQWSRTLPALDLTGMMVADGDTPGFTINVAADGFGPETTTIPVTVLDSARYAFYLVARDAQTLRRGVEAARRAAVRRRTWRHPRILGLLKELMRTLIR